MSASCQIGLEWFPLVPSFSKGGAGVVCQISFIGCDIVAQTTPAPPLEKEVTMRVEVGNLRTFI